MDDQVVTITSSMGVTVLANNASQVDGASTMDQTVAVGDADEYVNSQTPEEYAATLANRRRDAITAAVMERIGERLNGVGFTVFAGNEHVTGTIIPIGEGALRFIMDSGGECVTIRGAFGHMYVWDWERYITTLLQRARHAPSAWYLVCTPGKTHDSVSRCTKCKGVWMIAEGEVPLIPDAYQPCPAWNGGDD